MLSSLHAMTCILTILRLHFGHILFSFRYRVNMVLKITLTGTKFITLSFYFGYLVNIYGMLKYFQHEQNTPRVLNVEEY